MSFVEILNQDRVWLFYLGETLNITFLLFNDYEKARSRGCLSTSALVWRGPSWIMDW